MKRQRTAFRVGLLGLFAPLIFLTVTVIAVNFYVRTSSVLFDLSDTITREVSQKVIERSSGFLAQAADSTRFVAGYIARSAERNGTAAIDESLFPALWSQVLVDSSLFSLYVADQAGTFVQARRRPELATRVVSRAAATPSELWVYRSEDFTPMRTEAGPAQYDPRVRPWFVAALDTATTTWSDVYVFESNGQPGITASSAVRVDGRVVGVVGADIDLAALSDFLSRQHISDNGVVFITDAAGRVVAYPDTELGVLQTADRIQRVAAADLQPAWVAAARDAVTGSDRNDRAHGTIYRVDRRRYLAALVAFPERLGTDWQIVVALPVNDILGPVTGILYTTAAITLAVLLLAVAAVHVMSIRLSRPITALTMQTERVKQFHLEAVESVPSHFREVAQMNDAIQRMTVGLQAFRRYVPAELVRRLIRTGQEVELGGERKSLAIMFTDINRFSTISEQSDPIELMQRLSEYYNVLSQIILDSDGTIDKYIGDSIMAFWGAPMELLDGPVRACDAALQMRDASRRIAALAVAGGLNPFRTRIGIHTGEVVVGNMGGMERINYTVLGDNVNVANRIEEINKVYGTEIVVSDTVYQAIRDDFVTRPIDVIAPRGMEKGLVIYELMERTDAPNVAPMAALARESAQAFTLTRQGNWHDALAICERLAVDWPDDKPLHILLERCQVAVAADAEPPTELEDL